MSDLRASLAREIEAAIRARKMTNKKVAELAEVTESAITGYRRGSRTPSMTTSIKLGEALLRVRIVEIARAIYSSPCELCGRDTIDAGQQYKKRYCSKSCKSTAASRRARAQRRDARAALQTLYRQRLETTNRAIKDFCDDCTGREGICRDDECLLRPVSPLPFIPINGLRKKRIA